MMASSSATTTRIGKTLLGLEPFEQLVLRSLQIGDAFGEFVAAAVHGVDVALRFAVLLFGLRRLGHDAADAQIVGRFGQGGALLLDDGEFFTRLAETMRDVGQPTLD